MAKRSREFFANTDEWSEDFAAAVIDRRDAFQKRLKSSKRHDRIKRMWATVFMRNADGDCDETEISSGGRKGETLFVTPNRLGRLVRDHVTMVVQTKSLPEPQAANSDAESQDQVALAKGIIEHYKREADLEGVKAERAFVAEICGDSYLHVPWDADAGQEVAVADGPAMPEEADVPLDADGDTAAQEPDGDEDDAPAPEQRIVYEGDFRFSVRSPYDVSYERSTTKRKKPRWWFVDEPENRYDLLAQVQEEVTDEKQLKRLEKAILDAPAWSDRNTDLEFDKDKDEFDDAICVTYVYVETCRACPAGRFAKVLDKRTVLHDSPLGEPRAPVFALSQGNVAFRNEPTTPNHDGLPLADALTAQMSTILSNHANHGMQRVLSPRDANMNMNELDEGAGVVNYDHVDKSGHPIPEPKIWDAGAGMPELFDFYRLLASELDLVSGGSPVQRGDADSTKGDSGSKVAALFAAAQNIGSSFVAEVLRSEQELYTFLVDSLKRHATSKRVVSIVGEHNTFQAKEYTGDRISKITRVVVKQADAMRDTLQGRVAMVELLSGKTPEEQRQIVAIINTGLPTSVFDKTEPARILLERENEDLRNPTAEMPVCMPNDDHAEHWRSHMDQLNTPDARRDEKVYSRVLKHAIEHEQKLDPMSPKFAGMPALLLSGQKPLPTMAPPGTPPPPPKMNKQPGEETPEPSGDAPPNDPNHVAASKAGNLPSAPRMPTNPVDGAQMSTGGAGQPARPQASPIGMGA